MNDLKDWLNKLDKTIESYYLASFDDKIFHTEKMKDLSVILFYLTKERIDYKKKWDAAYFEAKKNNSSTASERIADLDVPEMYMLRRLHEVGKSILDTMRSHVSLLKQE
jgi:hypothetical protein